MREFFAEGARDVVEFEEGDDGGEADGYDGQVEVEDPAPGAARGEGAADDGAGDTADGPDDADAGEVVAAFAEGDHVCDDDFGDGDDASAAGTLDRTTYKHCGEVFGGGADDGADGEEGDGEEEEWSPAPEVGEGDEVGLPDHGGEEEGCSGPEGLDSIAFEGDGDDLWSISGRGEMGEWGDIFQSNGRTDWQGYRDDCCVQSGSKVDNGY